MIYSVLVGRDESNSKVVIIDCDPKEVENVAVAIYKGECSKTTQPMACVVGKGDDVSFRNYEILIADCM